MTTTRIPDLNDLARYRQPCAELAVPVRAGDADAIARARDVLAEVDAIVHQVDAAFREASWWNVAEAPGSDLVYALAGAEELSILIDEIDRPEYTRRLWEQQIAPGLRAQGWTDAEIEAERIKGEVPA